MLIVTFTAVFLVVATTVIHYEALRILGAGLRRIEVPEEISVVLSRDDDGRLHLTLEQCRDA